MRKLIPVLAVAVAIIFATLLALRAGQPPGETGAGHPQLDSLLVSCDATGSSLGVAYNKMAEHMHEYLATDHKNALAAARGQIANVIDGRLAICERALAMAMHDKRGSAVTAVGPFVEKLKAAHAALGELVTALETGSDAAAAKLDALEKTVH